MASVLVPPALACTERTLMMMMRRLSLALTVLMLTLDGALAEDDYGGEGSYAAIVGLGALDLGDTSSADEDSGGIGLRVGTFLSPNLALEVNWDWVEGVAHLATYDARVYMLTGRLQPFATIGIGISAVPHERLTGVWRGGAGADYFVSDSWKLTLEAVYAHGFKASGEVRHAIFGVGFGYHFY
jgi:hypothetical protein